MTFTHIFFLVAALATPLTAHAEDSWRELFNGKDLTGWKANAYPDSWSVVDGTIKAQATKESSHLFFIGDGGGDFVRFKDFELEVVARAEPNANSGVFIHTGLETHAAELRLSKGYEIQLNSTAKEKRKTGSLYAVVDMSKSPVDESQWFTVKITVLGPRITIQVNGETTVDYTEPSNAMAQRSAERKGRVLDPRGGAIALQAHDPGSIFFSKASAFERCELKPR